MKSIYRIEIDEESSEETPSSEVVDEVSSFEEKEMERDSFNLRDSIFQTLVSPTFNNIAAYYAYLNVITIFVSTVSFMVATVPDYKQERAFSYVECISITIFSLDYVLKLMLTRRHRIKWCLQFLNIIDLLAILPFYIEIVWESLNNTGDSTVITALVILRILRLFRVFRTLKLAKYSSQVPIAIRAGKNSGGGFLMALFTIALISIIMASGIYFAETQSCYWNDADGQWVYSDTEVPTGYQSIPHAMWWSIVTMTTVGYGDVTPRTGIGKMIGGITMLTSIFILIFPLTMLAGNFTIEYEKTRLEEVLKQNRRKKNKKNRDRHFHHPSRRCRWMYKQCSDFRNTLEETRNNILTFEESFVKLEYYVHRLRRHYERCEEEENAEYHNVRYQFY